MPPPVISVENLSKVYRLGSIGSTTLREDLSRGWARLRGKSDPTLKVGAPHNERRDGDVFWALRDINFEVKQGEVLGIIGANGAGKSTLLKILSRITAPSSGLVKVKGRVASLLEVGTGFHPDLSGRENIFLNGAILGMSKPEIRRKLDEIVAFSGLDEFIDTPVKRYSSGMYVRLAFAVAAHLDPEILILDEVLAVGDAQFQRKCTGKMDEVAKGGRTVLFVSHNLTAVASLCERAILLDKGVKVKDGPAKQVLEHYIGANTVARAQVTFSESDAVANNGRLRLASARVFCRGRITADVEIDEPITVAFDFAVIPKDLNACTSIHVRDKEGICAFVSWTEVRIHPRGLHRHSYTIPAHLLNDGLYTIDIFLITETTCIEVHVRQAVSFTVHETCGRKEYLGKIIGCVRPNLEIIESAL